jgi:hypothetical protein
MTKNEVFALANVRALVRRKIGQRQASLRCHPTIWSPRWVEEGMAKPTP